MSRFVRVVLAALLLFAGLPLLTAAGPPAQLPAQVSEHERIVEFWTVERVAQAVPRDFAYDPARGEFRQIHHRPDHAGGPGGGGGNGGGGDTVTGASWEGGGAVTETTGKVLFALGANFYVCSAGVVEDARSGASLVVTAAHCVYDNEGSGAFATNWMFIPNYDAAPEPLTTSGSFCAGTLHGCWTATALVVHDGFASAGGFNSAAIQHDFAFAVLEPGGHDGDTLVESLGTQGIQFTAVSGGTHVHAFGYPHASPYDGTDLVYCAGGVGFDRWMSNLTYGLKCNMTGGASGGPWFVEFSNGSGTVMSVNSYRYVRGPGSDSMYGPKFNANTKALYDAAHSATGNTIVGG